MKELEVAAHLREASVWRSPLVVGVVLLAVGVFANLAERILSAVFDREDGNPVAVVAVEQGQFLALLAEKDPALRAERIRAHVAQRTFSTETVQGRLDAYVAAHLDCSASETARRLAARHRHRCLACRNRSARPVAGPMTSQVS